MRIQMKRSYEYELDASSSRTLPKGLSFSVPGEVPEDEAKKAIKSGAAVKVDASQSRQRSSKKSDKSGTGDQGGNTGGSQSGGGQGGSTQTGSGGGGANS